MPDFKYLGWKIYTNTGKRYREWRLDEDVPELAVKGDHLRDDGPELGVRKRLYVSGPVEGEWKTKGRYSLKKVEDALGVALPAWRPPREADLKMTEALESVSEAMAEVTKAIDRVSEDRQKLEAIKNVVDGTAKVSPPPKAPEKSNTYLRLKGEHEYDSGDPYTDWELLVDVPEIKVTRTQGANPMHAVKGDVLREDEDDELTPFELRRNGTRIADPEWWQIRHLFAGLKDSTEGEEDGSATPSAASALHRFYRLAPAEEGIASIIMLAREAIPGTIVRAGDYLRYQTYGQDELPKASGAAVLRVPRAHFAIVGQHFEDSVGVLYVPHNPDPKYSWLTAEARLGKLRAYLGKQRKTWKDSTSPLFIIRPIRETLTEPIHATSDDAALFELLSQVGGRMPNVHA
jgi:hypothetical protein